MLVFSNDTFDGNGLMQCYSISTYLWALKLTAKSGDNYTAEITGGGYGFYGKGDSVSFTATVGSDGKLTIASDYKFEGESISSHDLTGTYIKQ